MDAADYWKARVVLLEMIRASDAADAARAATMKRVADDTERKLRDLGVPWAPGYRWDDVALTITPDEGSHGR